MKKYSLMMVLLLFIGISSCKKHHTLPKVAAPVWTVNNIDSYQASMTAVVEVPVAMQTYVQKGDELGAFIGDECRGVGQLVTVGDEKGFFVLIHGAPSEQANISFKYYASSKSNMYQTIPLLPFAVDGNYGSADEPEILDMTPVK